MVTSSLTTSRELDVEIGRHFYDNINWLRCHQDPECGGWSACPHLYPSDGSEPSLCGGRDHVWHPCYQSSRNEHYWLVLPEYSANLRDAWRLVEHMERLAWVVAIRSDLEGWWCAFGQCPESFGATVWLAICAAFVRADR